jgi:hypothetical protein
LDLVGSEGDSGLNPAGFRQRRNLAVGKNALVRRRKGERHAITTSTHRMERRQMLVRAI